MKKISGRGVDTEDLVQIGALGLIKAVKKFDVSFGVKFSTYAVPVIIGEIKRYIRDDNPIKISRSLKELSVKAKSSREVLFRSLGREPTMSEIADFCGVTSEEVEEAQTATTAPRSIYEETSSEDKTMQLEKIPASDYEEAVTDRIAIAQLLKVLKKRERQVIILRYFKDYTQTKTAEVIGVSQVQISRIEKKALEKIRQYAVF